ncbi:hypothetical protein BSL78_02543 [Apostichopus japonicus]|uniref:PIPK domain-containing protein n=1 Tax=Stichopus japonicus TaxID=307972 RepID=A0A2G8LJT1_STIJA|nr:hypothetical protein BSL78_02543 [Apostichopus japonicus]
MSCHLATLELPIDLFTNRIIFHFKLNFKLKLRQILMTDGAEASRYPGSKYKKIGHRGVDNLGNTVYKKTATTTLMTAIQLGIQHSVGGLSAKPERDVLLQDFAVVESVFFPREGSNITQAHQYPDFRFKTYAPVAFRYFRDLFGIQPDDYLISLVKDPLRELSNPGASGSIFYLSNDDEFIIKTCSIKRQTSSRSYCQVITCTKRKKSSPTLKDLDFLEERGGRTTPTFNGDNSSPPPTRQSLRNRQATPKHLETSAPYLMTLSPKINFTDSSLGLPHKLERTKSRKAKHTTTREAIQGQSETYMPESEGESSGGIPAKNSKGERLLLFLGIIDILQCYKLRKKLEHTYKAFVHDGDTVSVCRPEFFAKRFQDFMLQRVFKKLPAKNYAKISSGEFFLAVCPPNIHHQRGKAKQDSTTHRVAGRGGEPGTQIKTPELREGIAPPTSLEKAIISGGAKPKTSRPDLVPSTPPNSERETEPGQENPEDGRKSPETPRQQPEEVKITSASEVTTHTERTTTIRTEREQVTVQSSSVNETFDLTQP